MARTTSGTTLMSCGALQAYQLFKARAYGADAVLLIAAVLPNNDLEYLVAAAKKIGLQSLIEVGHLQDHTCTKLDSITGCCLLVKTIKAFLDKSHQRNSYSPPLVPVT